MISPPSLPFGIPAARRLTRLAAGLVTCALAGLWQTQTQAATARIEYAVDFLPVINNPPIPGYKPSIQGLVDSGRIYLSASGTDPTLANKVYYYENGTIKTFEPVPGISAPGVGDPRLTSGSFISYVKADASGNPRHQIYVDGNGNLVTHLSLREGAGTASYNKSDGHGLFAGTYLPDIEPTTHFAGSVLRSPDGVVQVLENTGFSQIFDDGWMVGNIQEILEVGDGYISYKNRPTVWIKGQQLMQIIPSDDASFSTVFGIRSDDRSTMLGVLGMSSIGGAAYLTLDGEKHYLSQQPTYGELLGIPYQNYLNIDEFKAINDAGVAVGTASGQRFLSINEHTLTARYQRDGLAYRWDRDNGVELLGDLIDPSLNLRLDQPVAINNLGQIAVRGHAVGSSEIQWYLLTPVPEPSAALLVGVALTLTLPRQRIKKARL